MSQLSGGLAQMGKAGHRQGSALGSSVDPGKLICRFLGFPVLGFPWVFHGFSDMKIPLRVVLPLGTTMNLPNLRFYGDVDVISPSWDATQPV